MNTKNNFNNIVERGDKTALKVSLWVKLLGVLFIFIGGITAFTTTFIVRYDYELKYGYKEVPIERFHSTAFGYVILGLGIYLIGKMIKESCERK